MSGQGGGRPPRCVRSGSEAAGVRSDASMFDACDPVAGQGIGFQVDVAFTGGEVLPFEDVQGGPRDAVGWRQAAGGALGVQPFVEAGDLGSLGLFEAGAGETAGVILGGFPRAMAAGGVSVRLVWLTG